MIKTSEMSISSSEGSPLPLDLTAKYQKLAAEYAKVGCALEIHIIVIP